MFAHTLHTPGPYIVRGEIEAGLPGYAMGTDPAPENGLTSQDCGWPYFIREDREFPLGSGPLWLAHGIQRKADADLFAAAPDMLAALQGVAEQQSGADFADGTVALILTDTQWAAVMAAIAKAEGKL